MRSKKRIIWMTAEQYAKLFGVTAETMRRNARTGKDFERGEKKKVRGRWYFRDLEDAYTVGPRLVECKPNE